MEVKLRLFAPRQDLPVPTHRSAHLGVEVFTWVGGPKLNLNINKCQARDYVLSSFHRPVKGLSLNYA